MKNAWIEEIKKDIITRLEDMIGTEICLCDLGFQLTECENATGSWYCSTYKAREEIAEHIEEYGLIAEYQRENFDIMINPLLESEKFHCSAMITLYEALFNSAVSDFEEWDEDIEVTPEFIERVKESLSDVSFEDIF